MVKKQGLAKSKIHVLEALLRLRQAACHPALLNDEHIDEPSAKLDVLGLHLSDLLEEGHKALVFSQFTSYLALVKRYLDQKNIVYEYLDGQTRNRKEHIDRFQTDPACGVFLISLKAGGLGLNLTAADYVFLLDPWWNPAVEMQAIDRAHRIGQTRQVFAYRLICRNTVEEKIADLQVKKKQLAEAILQADNNLISDLTAEDLELLLS
jgi:SNF2 family DNA or RNA helicase